MKLRIRLCDDDLQLNGYEEFALGVEGIKELIKEKLSKAVAMVNDEDDVETLLGYVTGFKISKDLGGFVFKRDDDVVVHNFNPANAMANNFLMKPPLKFVDLRMDCDVDGPKESLRTSSRSRRLFMTWMTVCISFYVIV
jgi:hypothetical protein